MTDSLVSDLCSACAPAAPFPDTRSKDITGEATRDEVSR